MAAVPASSSATTLSSPALSQVLRALQDTAVEPSINIYGDKPRPPMVSVVSTTFLGLSPMERRKVIYKMLGERGHPLSVEQRKLLAREVKWELLTPQQHDWMYA
eukprot:TRINITY_DN34841_c0_g1_i1.p1 TRINITY_DN34841_c0_g1~~TRINITY_DN34841_c0_g1_i1.p1  ORF type:complete len:111 (+),score=20.66 TRINITY_DN34841_c0_g1_i1:23-334(+)